MVGWLLSSSGLDGRTVAERGVRARIAAPDRVGASRSSGASAMVGRCGGVRACSRAHLCRASHALSRGTAKQGLVGFFGPDKGRAGRCAGNEPPQPEAGHGRARASGPAKRELVSFALCDEVPERPTADALLEKTLELAVMAREVAAPSNAVRVGDGWAYTEHKE